MTELLLLSNSRAPGQAFLEHAAGAVRSVPGGRTPPANVPAGTDLSFLLQTGPRFDVRAAG